MVAQAADGAGSGEASQDLAESVVADLHPSTTRATQAQAGVTARAGKTHEGVEHEQARGVPGDGGAKPRLVGGAIETQSRLGDDVHGQAARRLGNARHIEQAEVLAGGV